MRFTNAQLPALFEEQGEPRKSELKDPAYAYKIIKTGLMTLERIEEVIPYTENVLLKISLLTFDKKADIGFLYIFKN